MRTITHKDILNFVNEYFENKTEKYTRDDYIAIQKQYVTYLVFKYSTDVVTNNSIRRLLCLSNHSTILYHQKKVDELKIYDPINYRKLQMLEAAFIEQFNPDEILKEHYDLDSGNMEIVKLKRQVMNSKNELTNALKSKSNMKRKYRQLEKVKYELNRFRKQNKELKKQLKEIKSCKTV